MPDLLRLAAGVVWLCLVFSLQVGEARAEWTVHFATVAEGQRLLAQRDEYIAHMSPLDRSLRMRTEREVTEDEYLALASGAVRAWEEGERRDVEAALREIEPAISRLLPALQGSVYLVATSGEEEPGAQAYTRGNAIMLLARGLPYEKLKQLLAHEIFHVFTRQNPQARDALYAAIGFKPCSVQLPDAYAARRITNPDAPVSRHCIGVLAGGKAVQALPVLYATAQRYDPSRPGTLLDYLRFGLLLDQEQPSVVQATRVSGFFEQVGWNTQYIIHPEEIVADNFALLVVGDTDVASPEILQRISGALGAGTAR